MKVLNLRCEHGHGFEGWFASEDDFSSQNQRQLVACPMCGSALVQKMPSAPRLNLGARAEQPLGQPPSVDAGSADSTPSDDGDMARAARMQAALAHAARKLMASTEDVGRRFAQEARKMHEGEVEARPIRGQATLTEARQLIEEGIEVLPLPLAEAVQNKLH